MRQRSESAASLAVIAGMVLLLGTLAVWNPLGSAPVAAGASAGARSYQGLNETSAATSVGGGQASNGSTSASAGDAPVVVTIPGGWYSYSPSDQIKVLSVSASVSGSGGVSFSVTYENAGTRSVYVLEGGGSSLSVAVVSGASLEQVSSPRCLIAEAMAQLGPGEVATATSPGCWSGFHYQLSQPGTVQTQLTLRWENGASAGGGSGSLIIDAQFTLT